MNEYTITYIYKLNGINQYVVKKNGKPIVSDCYYTCVNVILADSIDDNDLYQEDGLNQITMSQARMELSL